MSNNKSLDPFDFSDMSVDLVLAKKSRNCIKLKMVLLLLVFTCGSIQKVEAQEAESKSSGPSLKIAPNVAIRETYTNNINLSSDRRSEFTTEISPGIQASSSYGRLKGNLNYSLTQILYARESSKNELQNSLNAAGTFEAIDNWAFLDFSGVISQQSISAFGTQSIDNASLNSNRTEVATYKISPYFRGKLSTFADYEARYGYTTTKSKSSLASDVITQEGLFRANGESPFSRLRWSADLNRQDIEYSAGRKTISDRARLTLTYLINSQLDTHLIGGRESDNYTSFDQEAHGSAGFGINWRLSDRTKFSAEAERRHFGTTHTFNFEHRTPRTAWTLTDNKSVSNSSGTQNPGGSNGLYDLLFNQFATIEPDPIKRAQLVSAFLQVNGLNPNATIVNNYSTASLSLQRSQAASFALMGIRDTITFSAVRSTNQSLNGLIPAADDFANANSIRQNGLTLSYSHRLTLDSGLNFLFSRQRTSSDSNLPSTTLRSFNINFSSRVGDKIYTNLGARHVISNGTMASYKETAVIGGLNIQF